MSSFFLTAPDTPRQFLINVNYYLTDLNILYCVLGNRTKPRTNPGFSECSINSSVQRSKRIKTCQETAEMNPDGVAATPADATKVVVESENDPESNGQLLSDQSPAQQPESSENDQKVENPSAALSQNEFNGKKLDPKNKTKVPAKPKPNTTGSKASNTFGVASRSAQSRVTNGVAKVAANNLAKKPIAINSEAKKTTSLGSGSQPRKGPTASGIEPRTPVKAAERKPVWAVKPAVTSANGGTRPQTTTSVQSTASKKPQTTSSSAAVKPKTTGTVIKIIFTLVIIYHM